MNTVFNISPDFTAEGGTYTFTAEINAASHVFEGHFPGNPIVPGVMSVILIRECAQKALCIPPTHFATIKEVKYLKPMTPQVSPLKICLTPADDRKTMSAEIFDAGGAQVVKFRGALA